jgi:cysteine desulfurase
VDGPIYLDYNATTPVDARVRDAMLPFLADAFGNPSSAYAAGQRTRDAVDRARGQVAALIGAAAEEIVFTAGGSESDNHAIIGTALASMTRGRHIITSCTEHPAVLDACRYLEDRLGFRVTRLPVDGFGLVDPAAVRGAVTADTVLATIMHANNEVGTVQPIEEIAGITRQHGIALHTDAAQSCGKIPIDVARLGVSLLTIAGHKLYAPKGIGALFIRAGTEIDPLIHGAGQEGGRRAGTEAVPGIVGLGAACEIAREALPDSPMHMASLRDRLHAGLIAGLGEEVVRLNGHPERRLPNTLNISIRGLVGEDLLQRIPEIAASTGAACHAGSTEPSGVLLAMGVDRELALGALRLTVGRYTTEADADTAAGLIVERAHALL